MRHPARGRAVHGMDPPQCATGDDLLDLAVVLAVAMLMAYHGLYLGRVEHALYLEALFGSQRHRFLEGNQPRPAFDARLDHGGAKFGEGAKAEDVRLEGRAQLLRVRALGGAKLGRRRIQTSWVDIADPYNLKASVGLKRRGMVHASLAHAYDHNPILLAHRVLPSHSRTLAMV